MILFKAALSVELQSAFDPQFLAPELVLLN